MATIYCYLGGGKLLDPKMADSYAAIKSVVSRQNLSRVFIVLIPSAKKEK